MQTNDILELAYEIEKSIDFLTAIKQITDQQQQAIGRLSGKLRDLFGDVFDGILNEFMTLERLPFSSTQRRKLLVLLEGVEEDYKEIMVEEALNATQLGKNQTISQLAQAGILVDETFDFSSHTYEVLRSHVFEASEGTLERMHGDVMDTLIKAYEDGVGIDVTSERLEKHFDSMLDYELERIARTEIIGHQNEGSFLTMEEFNIEYHQWWTAEDDDVRDSHDEIHGEIVRVGDEFSNGLKYPGDRDGPIEEWIQCRCGVVPFIIPEGQRFPTGQEIFREDDLIAA